MPIPLTDLAPDTQVAVVKIHMHGADTLILSQDEYAQAGHYIGVCKSYGLKGKQDIKRIVRTTMPARDFANLSEWNG